VWENGYAQAVNGATRGDALLDVYLVLPESLVNSCTTEQGISDHCGVLLEVEWEENYCRPKVERVVAVYNKTNILGLRTFLREKFSLWISNGGCVEEVWTTFKAVKNGVFWEVTPRGSCKNRLFGGT
jgi:hypothetical protein